MDIKGFPFLTQVAGGSLDDVEVGIKSYDAATGEAGKTIRIDDLEADMKGVSFSGDYSSATASSATGTATISYDELMKTAKSQPTDIGLGVHAKVVGLSDGGNGKIKVAVKVNGTVAGAIPIDRTVSVLSTVSVVNNKVEVRADSSLGRRPRTRRGPGPYDHRLPAGHRPVAGRHQAGQGGGRRERREDQREGFGRQAGGVESRETAPVGTVRPTGETVTSVP